MKKLFGRHLTGLTKTILLTSTLTLVIQASAHAFDGAILKAIKVDRTMDRDYVITIKTDKDLPIKKRIMTNNQLVLDLKNTRPAQFVNTVYGNSTAIENIIIQPFSGDKVKIFLRGSNIASGKVILDTRNEVFSSLPITQPALKKTVQPVLKTKTIVTTPAKQNTITVTQPKQTKQQVPATKTNKTTEFQPIYIDLSKDFAAQNASTTSNSSVEKVRSVTPIISYEDRYSESYNQPATMSFLSKIFTASPFDWALRFVMLGAVIIGTIKLLARPKNVQIPLASVNTKTAKTESKNIYKSAEAQKEILTKSLGLPSRRENLLKNANSALSSYGLKEYQNSQLPPRGMNLSQPARKPDEKSNMNTLRSKAAAKTATAAANIPAQPAQSKIRPASFERISRKQTEEAQKNFDGVKFLETMASIYQKSGRGDLATGIRENLIKKQYAA